MVEATFIPFPESVMVGATVVNGFAILCTLALVSVALRVSWLGIRWFIKKDGEQPQEYVFFNTQLGNYAACLLGAMAFNTGAGIMALPWLIGRGITLGTACTAQAFLNQVGTWAAGFFTVMIAVHTFISLVLKRKQSLLVSRSLMAIGWIMSCMMAALPLLVPHPSGEIYGADGLMCGFRSVYAQYRFFLHILPILVASVLSAVLYSIVFLVLRGTLKIHGGIRLTLDPNSRWSRNVEDDTYNRFIARVARSMVWYPVAYVALLVPYSITRLLELSGFLVPFQALVFACACWFMLGVVDAALLYNTFRVLGPAFDARSQAATTRKDLESWGPSAYLEKNQPSNFNGGSRAPITRQKAPRFHMPMPSYSSIESLGSEKGLLSSSSAMSNQKLSYGATAYSQDGRISNPKRSMDKAEALAHSHSPRSSISETYPYPRHVRSPSFAPMPMSADGRVERNQSASSRNTASASGSGSSPFRELRRSLSLASANLYSQATQRLPPRQLALLASRSSPSNSPRASPY
ncbi:hypothetical protein DFP72DRAFT_249870 [Ephemerocybe angulata]|uniref:G-protein coupled receptors family 2 profile 2 domain-containing protein n=1 Tax=Ephemerocybe angulata TaxID=980116 RepID=A0A8H6I3C6_9AGAR|nr:hypothetical protein DFP72DRAFT_249870 [Tulosesus angulatus]